MSKQRVLWVVEVRADTGSRWYVSERFPACATREDGRIALDEARATAPRDFRYRLVKYTAEESQP